MGKRRERTPQSQTLPSSPSHSFSSSSSDFEFTVSRSPHKSAAAADDLFYMGQLLPLHLSPRLSMVRTLLLSSSSSDTASSRDSTDSSFSAASSSSSSRPSSAAGDEIPRIKAAVAGGNRIKKTNNKYFSLSRFSSVFRRDGAPKTRAADPDHGSGSGGVKSRAGLLSAKEVIQRYLKKVSPLYGKLSQSHRKPRKPELNPVKEGGRDNGFSQSFSGNLRYPRRRSHVSSCPSSIRSSPSRSCGGGRGIRNNYGTNNNSSSSTEELQSAIQGAIAYCKSSMIRNETMVSHEI